VDINFGQIRIFGGTKIFLNQIASYLTMINGTLRGRRLLNDIQGKLGPQRELHIKNRRQGSHMAYTSASYHGVYKLESFVLLKDWVNAVREVHRAVKQCRTQDPQKLTQVRYSLEHGIPAITYSHELNKRHADLAGESQDDTYRNKASGFGAAINTALPMDLTGVAGLFAELLQEPNWRPNYAYAALPISGWYILLRELLPYLQPGLGCQIQYPTIEVNGVDEVSLDGYTAGESPAVVLAHELIHAHNSLFGVGFRNDAMEEAQTVGLHPYTTKEFTERYFRIKLKGTGFQDKLSQGMRNHY